MSLVLEALRRVEKPGARPGSSGAAVASYAPASKKRGGSIPLILGLVTGGVLFALFDRPIREALERGGPAAPDDAAGVLAPHPLKGGAGLPPPLILETLAESAPVTSRGDLAAIRPTEAPSLAAPSNSLATTGRVDKTPASLVLQAISERDARPIAVISDRLVGEGEKFGSALVVKIGAESVDLLLESGAVQTLRFLAPALPDASPSIRP